jgi:hypothetical protein
MAMAVLIFVLMRMEKGLFDKVFIGGAKPQVLCTV